MRTAEQGEIGNETDGSRMVAARVSRRAAERLRGGHLWVYRSDIEALADEGKSPEEMRGRMVSVVDPRGVPLGWGMYSSASQIAIRMISAGPVLGREALLTLIQERVRSAIDLRDQLAPLTASNNGRRLVFSEADGLPGVVADQYSDLVILQLLTQGVAREDVRGAISEAIAAGLGGIPVTIWERPDQKIRQLEDLPAVAPGPLFQADPGDFEARSSTVFNLNGLRFLYDASSGQKTGAFLDQRLNYQAAATYARGRVLDVCTYQGGFAMHLAGMCDRVTGVDASHAALEVADRNLAMNTEAGNIRAEVDWIEADAFDLLREFEAAGERYGTIVLDPPAFAKSRRATEGAMRGYKELNLRAMKMLELGGTLVTCSCSHHVSTADFTGVIAAAAADSRRRVQVLESRGAAPDHPAVLTLPETSYLKCLICRVG